MFNSTMYLHHHFEVVTSVCKNSSAPHELSIASATVSSLLLLITIPTNLLVCLAILIDPNGNLRTQFNCFTFNLALADLFVGCVTEPVSVYAHITEARSSKVHPVVLRLFHIPYFISAMASVLSIGALALERYLAVTSPFRYLQHFDMRLSVFLSVAIWIIALTFGLLNIFLDYILESFIFVNSGALFTIAVVCFAGYKIRSTLRQISNQFSQILVQSPNDKLRRVDTEMKLTKTFALMIGVLMCCYIPACSIIYFMNVCQKCDCELIQWFRDVAFWLILLNSAINPFIYAVRSSPFKNAIKDLVRCNIRRNKKPERKFVVAYAKTEDHRKLDPKAGQTTYGTVSTAETEDGELSVGLERVRLV